MVVIKKVTSNVLLDSRKEKTISVTIHTSLGKFSSSSPTGKSTGRYEVKPYKKTLEQDIETLKKFSDYFSEDIIEKFEDLRRIEDIVDRIVGANTLFALESAILKALAKEQKKNIWQIINPNAKKFPKLVANIIGGGKHSHSEKKPDFQEFEVIPATNSAKESYEIIKKIKKESEMLLKEHDKKFRSEKNDENAWIASLTDKEVLDVLKKLTNKFDFSLGVDIAASSFYKRKKYNYNNPNFKRTPEEQFLFISNLIKNYNLFYVEDPFQEDDFDGFAKLLKKFPQSLIVGDDLTATNPKRIQKAIEKKSINGLIIKPNQIGSLLKVKEAVELAKKHKIKTIFSHRSGETKETILADLAFGFEADFFKSGSCGDVREEKIKRLIEIEKSF